MVARWHGGVCAWRGGGGRGWWRRALRLQMSSSRSRGGGVVVAVMVAPCTVGAACGESSAGRRVKGVCNEGEPDGSIVHDAKL